MKRQNTHRGTYRGWSNARKPLFQKERQNCSDHVKPGKARV